MNNLMGDIGWGSAMALAPELYLLAVIFFLLLYGVYRAPRINLPLVGWGVLALALTAGVAICSFAGPLVVMNGLFSVTLFTLWAKCLILGASALVLLLGARWLCEDGGRPFEFIILLLLATLGMLCLVSANHLLALYMALEMMSLALYVLASFSRDSARSSEAGLKYFVLGALASGMMLFGMSLVYGFSGALGFAELGQLFAGSEAVSKGVVVGLVLIITGFCFKLSAVPFHMWTPDVYEGAPTPVTAFFATAPKIAALALFAQLLMGPFGALMASWQQVIILVALFSMVLGAVGAIAQTNIKRLLAYSSIGHVGFMLMALAAGSVAGVQAMLVYLALYVFMSAGVFACVQRMQRDGAPVEQLSELAGLSKTNPWLAFAIAVFMFSMAGIPPLSGFFGKLYAVLAAVQAGLAWLAVAGVLASVVGAYYYLRVVKLMYFDEPKPGFDKEQGWPLALVLTLGAGVTLLFFLLPTPLVNGAKLAAQALLVR